jgi:hypothetical protein
MERGYTKKIEKDKQLIIIRKGGVSLAGNWKDLNATPQARASGAWAHD